MTSKRLAVNLSLCICAMLLLILTGAHADGEKIPITQKIDINCATIQQLCTVPEIDSDLAKAIDNHRKWEGTFNSIQELELVPGLTLELIEKISPWLKDISSDRCTFPNPQPGDHDWDENPTMDIPKC